MTDDIKMFFGNKGAVMLKKIRYCIGCKRLMSMLFS